MARISFGPTPWSVGGGLAGGLAEGLAVGQGLSLQRQQMELQKQQMQQATEMQKSGQYFKMLEAAVKAGDVAPEVANALINMATQGMGGSAAGAPAGIPPFPSIAERRQKEGAQLDAIIKDPSLSPEQKDARLQLLGIKSPKEMMDFTLPDGRTVRVSAEKGAQLMQQEMLKEIALAAKGGGGKGGGGKEQTMIVPDGQGGFKFVKLPPGKYRNAPSWLGKPEDADQPLPPGTIEKLAPIAEKVGQGKKLTATDQALYDTYGPGISTGGPPGQGGSINPTALRVPSRFNKGPKKKARAAQAPPVQMYEAPPPPDEE